MAGSAILAAGLSIVIAAFVLVLLAELYYMLCWRRRVLLANPRVSQGIAPLPDIEDVDAASSLGHTIRPATNCSNVLDRGGSYVEQVELVAEKLFPATLPAVAAAAIVKLTTKTTDIDTSTTMKMSSQAVSMCTTSSNLELSIDINPDTGNIQLNTLMSLPRMLFTIKEEEDLETGILSELPNKTSTALFKPITTKSMENLQQLAATTTSNTTLVVLSPPNTPFVTPPSSPLHNSPVAGSSSQANNYQPLHEAPICNSGLGERSPQMMQGDLLPNFELEQQPDSSHNDHSLQSQTHSHHHEQGTYHSHVDRSSEEDDELLDCSLAQAHPTNEEFRPERFVAVGAGNLADTLHCNSFEKLFLLPDHAAAAAVSPTHQSSPLLESFSPSLESFKTPLDSTPPLGFGVEILSLAADEKNGGSLPPPPSPPPPPILIPAPPSKSLTLLYPSSPLSITPSSLSSPKSPSSSSLSYASPTRSASSVSKLVSSPRTSPVSVSTTSSIELHSL